MTASMDPESLSHLARSLDRRLSLGQLAVLNGFLTADALEDCLREHRSSGKPLGGLLVSRRHLTPAELSSLLKEQALLEHDGAGRIPEGAEDVERMIGRYALVRKVGAGGAGVVWKAWDTQLERWVAIKEPQLDRGVSTERFLREARAAAQLKHPNLIQIFEVGEQDGLAYLVMDFVEGRRLDECAMDPGAAASTMALVCDAVEAMHARGVVHRDIKPQNILIDSKGEPHLGDFGLAKLVESSPLTIEGGFLGTPQYAAPEQVVGKREEIGPGTDVYGLGATLYHVLSGRPPFAGEEIHQVLDRKRREMGPRPIRDAAPSLSPELALVVSRAMESRRADRYPSAAALADDLRRVVRGERPSVRPPSAWDHTRRLMRRHSRGFAAAAFLGLVLAGVAALRVREYRRDAAYETARQKGDEWWTRSVGLLRTGDREGLRKSLQEAVLAYAQASAEAPSRPYPWLMNGRCNRLSGNLEVAEKAWTKALDLDPEFGPARLERAKLHLSAVANLRVPSTLHAGATVRFGPPEPETSGDALQRKKGEEDLAAARNARGLEPGALDYLEGMLALGSRDFQKATDALRRYTADHPWDASALAMQGASEYYSLRFEEAEATWSKVVALEPLAERYRALGHVRFCRGRIAEAIAAYDQAVLLKPDHSGAFCDRGAAEQARGEFDRAIADYSTAIKFRPGFARAYNNRGTALAEKKQFEEAHRDFQAAQEASPFYVEAYVNRGILFVKQGKTAEAAEELEAACEIDPTNVDARTNRGMCRILLLEYDQAIEDLNAALARSPGNAEALFLRAQAREGSGDTSTAIKDMQEALRRAPERWLRRSRAEDLLKFWMGPR
jgi:tetratricopeptide (TPR) repeat protein